MHLTCKHLSTLYGVEPHYKHAYIIHTLLGRLQPTCQHTLEMEHNR